MICRTMYRQQTPSGWLEDSAWGLHTARTRLQYISLIASMLLKCDEMITCMHSWGECDAPLSRIRPLPLRMRARSFVAFRYPGDIDSSRMRVVQSRATDESYRRWMDMTVLISVLFRVACGGNSEIVRKNSGHWRTDLHCQLAYDSA
jgi:hypothetical protein